MAKKDLTKYHPCQWNLTLTAQTEVPDEPAADSDPAGIKGLAGLLTGQGDPPLQRLYGALTRI